VSNQPSAVAAAAESMPGSGRLGVSLLAMLDQVGEGVCMLDASARVSYLNAAAERLLGCTRGALLGHSIGEVFPGAAGAIVREHVTAALDQQIALVLEAFHPATGIVLEVRCSPAPEGLGLILRDTSGRRSSEEALRIRDRALESTSSGILITDLRLPDNPIIYCNPAFERITGYEAAEVLGRNCRFLQGHETDRAAVERIRAAIERGLPVNETLLNYRKDGTPFWNELTLSPIRDADGRLSHYVGVQTDVTAQRRASDAARFQAHLLDIVEQAVIATDLSGVITYWNHYAEVLYGWSAVEVIGAYIQDITVPQSRLAEGAEIIEQLRAGLRWSGEFTVRRRDGTTFPALVIDYPISDESGELVGLVGVSVDLSDRKRLEAQLLHAQRMESVGRLAGGVAHDFNNLLTAIVGCTELVELALAPGHPALEDLRTLQHVAERAGHLTRQLLAFARKQMMEPVVLCPSDLVVGLSPIFRRLVSEEIELVILPNSEAGVVRADPVQIEQVLVNLVVNARDAMPYGGKLTIETADITFEPIHADRHIDARAGDYVVISVSDTGVGMSAEVQAHAFDPFFTTKDTGKGTGLGLSTCYGIVKQHGGHLWLYSEEGHGTTFKIYLPRVHGVPSDLVRRDLAALPVGTESVLLVEDEETLRRIAARTLRGQGYTVLEASNGLEALAAARAVRVDLLVTDVVMPQMRGDLLCEQITARYPHIRTLFMSGYTDSMLHSQGWAGRHVAFLQKPFSPMALARKVREVLDS
jgi:two-component system, cell cycle sensor histidine kinase and response regulator CckA